MKEKKGFKEGTWRCVYWSVLGVDEAYIDWVERMARDPVQALGFVMNRSPMIKRIWANEEAGKVFAEVEILGDLSVVQFPIDDLADVDGALAGLGRAVEEELKGKALKI